MTKKIIRCPKCGKGEIENVRKSYPYVRDAFHRCNHCGYMGFGFLGDEER
jgi:uncharacterized Zn finger protein